MNAVQRGFNAGTALAAALFAMLPSWASGAAAPDFTGVWSTADGAAARTSSSTPIPQLPLRPEARQRFDAFNRIISPTGDTPGGVCLGTGMPGAMLGAGGYPFEII